MKDFQPVPSCIVSTRQGSAVSNIFQDDMIRTQIDNARYEFIKSLVQIKHDEGLSLGFGRFEMPPLKEVNC